MNFCMCEVIFTLLANPMCVSYCNTKLKNVAILGVDMLNNVDPVTIVCHKCINFKSWSSHQTFANEVLHL